VVKIDFCIVGLGNPDNKYFNTRHNIGFLVADKLAQFFKIQEAYLEEKYAVAVTLYKDKTVALLKPLTYMNLSGQAVTEFLENYDVRLDDMLIVYDDVELDFGTLRMRPSGSDGGHNGMHSIIYELITENVPRLRIGIGSEQNPDYLVDYVLSEFTKEEKKNLDKILNAAKDAVLCFMDEGIEVAMNNYNRSFL
jgi:peptidyl-tRNA hydrolase, PTH1 family